MGLLHIAWAHAHLALSQKHPSFLPLQEALISYFPEAEALLAGEEGGSTPRTGGMDDDDDEGADMDGDRLGQHHKDAYIARKLLPRLVQRAAGKWPSTAQGIVPAISLWVSYGIKSWLVLSMITYHSTVVSSKNDQDAHCYASHMQ
jgi:hypothetical protein